MKKITNNQKGAILVIFAVTIFVLLGFVALALEAGRWYLTRAELSKGADAAALVAMQYNSVYDDAKLAAMADEFGQANFKKGFLGTPETGDESATFNFVRLDDSKIKVTGNVNSPAYISQLFGMSSVEISTSTVSQKMKVEIMLVLDRSGSMSGTKISDLKTAAKTFVDLFKDSEAEDKAGLISFATSVTVNRALGTNFVSPMKTAINSMSATGATNMEDALDQADGPSGFTDQTGVPVDKRVQQFLVFFSDGMPTAFRDTFKKNGTNYDAVVCATGNCTASETKDVYTDLGKTGTESWWSVNPVPSGNGLSGAAGVCKKGTTNYQSTLWPGQPTTCNFNTTGVLGPYVCATARSRALTHAQELKDKKIKIYCVGLGVDGAQLDRAFLTSLSSGESYTYITPSSSELKSIFSTIAKEIKLRLIY